MSNHRLTAWLPENNHIYTDLNKPKPVIYKARFLEHEGSRSKFNRTIHWYTENRSEPFFGPQGGVSGDIKKSPSRELHYRWSNISYILYNAPISKFSTF